MYLRLILLSLLSLLIFEPVTLASISGSVEYSPYKYSKNDVSALIRRADANLKLYENTEDEVLKQKYLKEALRFYYICTKSDFNSIDAHIGLGKAYDELGVDKYAKMEFNSAYNIDNRNPKLNYRYGDFYYKRKQLNLAQHYFERAYKFGYSNDLDLNMKMAKTYIKLAEPSKAQTHMTIASNLQKEHKETQVKIAVSSTMKRASSVSVVPVNTLPVTQKTATTVEVIKKEETIAKAVPPPIKVEKTVSEVKKQNIFDKFSKKVEKNTTALYNASAVDPLVKTANSIKMIDDADDLKPMYYLFIK